MRRPRSWEDLGQLEKLHHSVSQLLLCNRPPQNGVHKTMTTCFAHNSVDQQFGLCSAKWFSGWAWLSTLACLKLMGGWVGAGVPWRPGMRGLVSAP